MTTHQALVGARQNIIICHYVESSRKCYTLNLNVLTTFL